MSVAQQSPELQPTPADIPVALSNVSLPVQELFLGDVASVERYTTDIGQGEQVPLEIMPVQNSRLVRQLVRRGHRAEKLASNPDRLQAFHATDEGQTIDRLVASVHSSPTDLTEPGFDLLGRILFGQYQKSLRKMDRIQSATGRELPAILYANFLNGQIEYGDHNAPFYDRSLQPKATDLKRWGLTEDAPVDDIKTRMDEHGFTSLTVDVAHIFDIQDGESFRDPQAFVERMVAAGLVQAMHWAVGRSDVAKGKDDFYKQTMQALAASETSAEAIAGSPEGKMAGVIIRHWKNSASPVDALTDRRIVIELMPGRDVAAAKNQQTAVVANLREFAAGVSANN